MRGFSRPNILRAFVIFVIGARLRAFYLLVKKFAFLRRKSTPLPPEIFPDSRGSIGGLQNSKL